MTLLLLAVSLIPLLISMLILTSQSSSVVESDTKDQQMHLAELSTSEINAWLNGKIASIQSVVKAHPDFINGKVNAILPVLKIMAESNPEVYRFAYIDPLGMSIDTAGDKLDASKFDNLRKLHWIRKYRCPKLLRRKAAVKTLSSSMFRSWTAKAISAASCNLSSFLNKCCPSSIASNSVKRVMATYSHQAVHISFTRRKRHHASCFCAACHCTSYDSLTDDDPPNHDDFIPHAASRAR